ncbi:SRPBCC family protein [Leptospira idonii]|uniref:Polyketide cyclase n=1 Tax=Leptospira idonii TaxID=1193500 RepID=A0A4R9LXY8_9LEPT|nr:SRPBCC family protein [Leptospira idonii]TGN19150.1 hypothetical protein EHS15_10335 [Leptospira idonii]
MKKIILGILGAFVLAIAVLSFIAPSDFKLEREIVINQPVPVVFNHLKYLRNHELWNAWSQIDPNMKKSFSGTDGTVGFTSSWESEHEEVGTAEEEIKNIKENERFDTQIRFKKPFEASFNSYITTESVGEKQTKVVLGMADKMPFPVNVISFIVNVCLDQQQKIIDNMDKSLNSLKSILEK